MRAGREQAHPPVERLDQAAPCPRELRAQIGNGDEHGRHDLDLRGPELGLEALVRQRGQNRLDRIDRLQRLAVDEDQLLLEPDRRQPSLQEAALVQRGESLDALGRGELRRDAGEGSQP